MSSTPTAPEVKQLFNQIAPMYDHLNDWISLGQHQVWKQMTVKWCEPARGDLALDLCCGSGDLTILLAKRLKPNGLAIGVDFSPQQLAIAKAKAEQNYPHLPLQWVEADVLELPFQDNYFNCATMGYGLRNVTDQAQSLKEIYRVVRTGGKVAILDFHRPKETYLRNFQQWYFDTIVVPLAQKFNLTEEYAYLHPSIERFPSGDQQVKLAQEVGFTKAIHYPITGGMMGVLVLEK